MTLPKILVTGATGKTGGAVVRQLREKGLPVRAIVRTRDSRSETLASLGVDVVVADMFDPEQLAGALKGVHRAYYCPPISPYTSVTLTSFLYAAEKARLESVVAMTQWLASPHHPTQMTRDMWTVEQIMPTLRNASVTILNPGFFADNYFRVAIGMAAQLGLYANLVGDSQDVPPSNEDIARVAAAVLVDPARHDGRRYRITGPALIGVDDIVGSLSRVLKRTVRPFNAPEWLLNKVAAYRFRGDLRYDMAVFHHYLVDHRQGAFALGGPTDAVAETTGKSAESLDETVLAYAARSEAQRNLSAFTSAFSEFMASPLWRGYDHDRHERQIGVPKLGHSQYAMEDEQWKADRLAQLSGNRIVALGTARSA